nr:FAD-dependent oxidoreductase [Azospirillum agricola]
MDILPLASPKAWAHMPRWILDPLGPLSIAPRHLPALAPWLLRFVAASRPGRIAAGSRAIHALNAASLPAWERRLVALGLDGHLRRRGILSVWMNAAGFAASTALHARQTALGIPVERLDSAALRALEPAFGAEVAGGALYPTGAHVGDPRLFTEALADAARARGARVAVTAVEGLESRADGVVLRLGEGRTAMADHAVIACGAWAKPLAAAAGTAYRWTPNGATTSPSPPARWA